MSFSSESRKLKIFLCHSSGDKERVRTIYSALKTDGYEPWLDEVNLLPGQDWRREIEKAVKTTDVVLVCLSETSINKRGFVQKEIAMALDCADLEPEGAIYIIPLKLEECEIPLRLAKWQWLTYSQDETQAYSHLLKSLQERSRKLSIPTAKKKTSRLELVWEVNGINVDTASAKYRQNYESSIYTRYNNSNTDFFKQPYALAVDSNSNVYIADTENHRVVILDSDGLYLSAWGSYGATPEKFIIPEGIAVDKKGNIYVTDGADRIQKYNRQGEFLEQFGSSRGDGLGQLHSPQGISVNGEGFIFVVDTGNKRIQKLDPKGKGLAGFSELGTPTEKLANPFSLALDSKGNCFVGDFLRNGVVKFDNQGRFVKKWGYGEDAKVSSPRGLAVDSQDNIYIINQGDIAILEFSNNGDLIRKIRINDYYPKKDISLCTLALDKEDNIFVINHGGYQDYSILKFRQL